MGLSPGEKQYQAIFNPKTILNSFTWYSAWSLGLPETLIDFIGPGLKLNPTLMRYWGNFYIFIFSSFGISIATLAAIFIYLIKKSGNLFLDKRILLFLLWFPVGIAPVIFLPAHKSTHYLIFVLPAFWVTIIFTTLNFYRQSVKLHPKLTISITTLLIISLIILSIASIKLGENTYWAATRGRLAEKLIKQVKSAYPALPEGAALYFTNDKNYPFLTEEWGGTSKQASLILNGSDAIQLLYKDRTLKVYYEDLGGLPDNLKNRRVYPQVAKLH